MSVFLAGVVLAYVVIFVYKTKTGSPYLPSKKVEIEKMLKYVGRGKVVADMGAGDGRLLIEAVRAGAREAWGWEIEPLVWLKGKLKIKREKANIRDKIHLKWGDMWQADLSKVDVLLVYQLEKFNQRLAEKCKREMKSGTIVVANRYPIEGLKLWRREGNVLVYRL